MLGLFALLGVVFILQNPMLCLVMTILLILYALSRVTLQGLKENALAIVVSLLMGLPIYMWIWFKV
jgi:hypothetical protein